jgi:aspartate aminotransferase
VARALWSNPPTHGARIAAEVVGDPAMFEEWKGEMAGMAGRIAKVGGFAILLFPLFVTQTQL